MIKEHKIKINYDVVDAVVVSSSNETIVTKVKLHKMVAKPQTTVIKKNQQNGVNIRSMNFIG
ncbi:MAG: hypothetical protein O3C63_06460 [Cyanobacteria bacterium]|nr:hypothetical protein [Cyanobacteriota bacterium]MDA1021426.1 hypothetical protein [Cyanobacteriota bacterium]